MSDPGGNKERTTRSWGGIGAVLGVGIGAAIGPQSGTSAPALDRSGHRGRPWHADDATPAPDTALVEVKHFDQLLHHRIGDCSGAFEERCHVALPAFVDLFARHALQRIIEGG